MPPANQEPKGWCSRVGMISAVQLSGWLHRLGGMSWQAGRLKSPSALGSHRVGTGLILEWQNKHFPVLLCRVSSSYAG